MELSLGTVLVVAVIALAAPLLVQLAPPLRLPAVVLEILLGILVGPSGFDWVEVDVPTEVLALFGLGFLLFLAGLEIDPHRLKGAVERVGLALLLSFGLALACGWGVEEIGETSSPLFVAVGLVATSLGLVVPVLRDAGQTDTELGQLVLAGSSAGEFSSIVLVSLFFSQESSSTGATVFMLSAFSVLVVVVGLALTRAGRSMRLSATLLRLEETTAQLGVRVAVVLLAVFFVMAADLGLETILGAFVAGALLRVVDRDEHLVHERFRAKIEAIGYGFLVPVFFVSSGMRFDADALFAEPEHLALVPAFLGALLVVRGLPALLYRPIVGTRRAVAAGLLQATSLTFLVVAAHLGRELDVFDAATGSALLAAGLLSVVLFPPIALGLLTPPDGRASSGRT
ncbi:MAG: cation:proton antiporter [Actinomycetota bacterium]